MKQSHTYHGGKPVEKCFTRKGRTVSIPSDTTSFGPEQQKLIDSLSGPSRQFPSISQAKHFCLDLMRKGFQIRKVV